MPAPRSSKGDFIPLNDHHQALRRLRTFPRAEFRDDRPGSAPSRLQHEVDMLDSLDDGKGVIIDSADSPTLTSSSLSSLISSLTGDSAMSVAIVETEHFQTEGRYSDRRADLEIKSLDGQVFLVHMFLLAEESTLVRTILATLTVKLLDFLTASPTVRQAAHKNFMRYDIEEAYIAIVFLGCDGHIKTFKMTMLRSLDDAGLWQWAYLHGHDSDAITIALLRLFPSVRIPQTVEQSMRKLMGIPSAYAAQIIARTVSHVEPSVDWAQRPEEVKDFIRLAKMDATPAGGRA